MSDEKLLSLLLGCYNVSRTEQNLFNVIATLYVLLIEESITLNDISSILLVYERDLQFKILSSLYDYIKNHK